MIRRRDGRGCTRPEFGGVFPLWPSTLPPSEKTSIGARGLQGTPRDRDAQGHRGSRTGHRRPGRAHAAALFAHAFRDHRRAGLDQVREPAVHGFLQGARGAQQAAVAVELGKGGRRHRHVGRQPCAGRRLPRRQARHSRDHRDAQGDAIREGGAHPQFRRARDHRGRDAGGRRCAFARDRERGKAHLRPSVRR